MQTKILSPVDVGLAAPLAGASPGIRLYAVGIRSALDAKSWVIEAAVRALYRFRHAIARDGFKDAGMDGAKSRGGLRQARVPAAGDFHGERSTGSRLA